MKHIDDVTYADVGLVQEVECPECGRAADLWEDETGWGYRCYAIDCMSFDALGGE